MEEALTYFDEAMKLLDTLSGTEKNRQRRISLLVNQWLVFLMLSKSPEYLELLTRYEPIAVGLSNPGLLGLFYSGMVVSEYWLGNFDTAIQKATKAVELCQAAGNFEGAGLAYMVIQWSYLYKGDYDKAIALKEDTLLMTEKQFNLRVYMWAFAAVSYAYTWLGRWDEAVREGQEAMRIAEEYSAKSIISFAALGLSFAYTAKGDLARGKEYAELSINKGPTPTDKLWSLGGLAESLIRAGELHRGIEIQSDLLPKFRAVRYCIGEVESLLCLGEGYYLAGEYNKAKQMLKECLNLSDRCGMKVYVAGARRLLGEISLKTNPAQAAGHFEKSISIYQEIKVENELAKAYAGYGRFHKQNDNMAQARVYLTKALEIFERLGTLIEPDKVRKELTSLPEA
jgi:tetratricopeptide (TPR) repeat protein